MDTTALRCTVEKLTAFNLPRFPGISFENAVVGAKGTVQDDDMPFVNRYEELWDLFMVNAKNMSKLKSKKNPITDFRPFKMLFCVQVLNAAPAPSEAAAFACV